MKLLRNLRWITPSAAALLAAGLLLLCFPQPLFTWSTEADNLALYSDSPFTAQAGGKLLAAIQSRLSRSPLYSRADSHAIFICNSSWRRRLFFWPDPNAGGLNYSPLSSNVFLVGADIAANRLIKPSGKADILGRGLDHFVAHEIAHTLTCRAVGFWEYRRLPDWVKEGYAEYVARGPQFNCDASLAAFLAGAPEMNQPALAPYRRYELLVGFLLEKKGWTLQRLLEKPIDQRQAEQILISTVGE